MLILITVFDRVFYHFGSKNTLIYSIVQLHVHSNQRKILFSVSIKYFSAIYHECILMIASADGTFEKPDILKLNCILTLDIITYYIIHLYHIYL